MSGKRLVQGKKAAAHHLVPHAPGEGIWEQFDKVLVIDQGHLVYFGPRDQARAYFHGLGFAEMPRQTSADYVTGCTDASVRRFAPGHDKRNTPTTPKQLERAYRQSSIYARAMEEREKVEIEVALDRSLENEFKEVVIETKHKVSANGVRLQLAILTSSLALVTRASATPRPTSSPSSAKSPP